MDSVRREELISNLVHDAMEVARDVGDGSKSVGDGMRAHRETVAAIMSAFKRGAGVVVSDGFADLIGILDRHVDAEHYTAADALEDLTKARSIAKRITSAVEPSCVVTDEVEIDEPSIARDEPTVTVETHGGGIAGVDESIAPLVKLLNDGGIATAASCSGHGQRPGNIALADGRELIIARNWNEARLIDGLFPGINGEPAKGIEGALEFIRQSSEDVRADERRAWRPGDVVRHKPSGEEWVILRIDLDSDSLIPAGWPKSRARVSDCVFVKAGDPNSYVGGEIARALTVGGE